ncbi:hypothetical protein [Bacillus safensis]|uniref:hypothetical protein n=1 Tax=Bacillus safensis TaxID=561879 RepID=UPI003394EEFE
MKSIEKSLLKLERSLETTSNKMEKWKRQQLILIALINVSVVSILIGLLIIYIFR